MPETATAEETKAHTVTIEEAKARLGDLVERVRRGEEWVIVDDAGRTVAVLGPGLKEAPPDTKRWKAFGMMKGQIEMAPDFDESLDDFKPYME